MVIRGIRPRTKECRVVLWGAHIAGSLEADAVNLIAPYGKQALEATLCRIDGSVHFRNQCRIQGQIRLQNASIGKTLDLSGGRYSNPFQIAISIERTTVGSSVILRDDTCIEGRLTAVACSVGGNIELVGVSIFKSYPVAVNMSKSSVSGNIIIARRQSSLFNDRLTTMDGDLRLVGVTCHSELMLDGLAVQADSVRDQNQRVPGCDLADVSARTLRLKSLMLPTGGTLSLKGASADVLDDDLDQGYGDKYTKLSLAGLRYQQLATPDGHSKRGLVGGRVHWLRRQGKSFNPDGYANLALSLSRQGFFEDARRIKIAEKLHELRGRTPWLIKPFGLLFWVGFEFGYSSSRALLTLVFSVLLGWVGVIAAEQDRALVLDATAVASVSSQSGEVGISIASQQQILQQPICGDAIDPLYYALDLMVPVVDFRQEQKCSVSAAEQFAVWRMLKTLYVLWGWIVVSLAVFTFSSAIVRSSERSVS